MKKITVLGAGMVGSAIAVDLAQQHSVLLCDISDKQLNPFADSPNIAVKTTDLSNAGSVTEAIAEADLVIGAVPGYMGYQTMKTVIEAGKNIVDISFFPEDPFSLDGIAKEKNVTAVMDCGVAPGMGNIILGYHNNHMEVTGYRCYVGGLPLKRVKPFEYKAPFSPIDVIEEYTRPARIVINGDVVTREALSDPEYIEFDEVGTLEAFNTDGLRTLLHTVNIPTMIEKTLRYPGHIDLMRSLRSAGFFSEEPVAVGSTNIKPIDFTTALLFPIWKLEQSDMEFTIMTVIVEGKENGSKITHTYRLFDTRDENGISSMARTTGYTCTAAANLLLEGEYRRKGLIPPEYLGEEKVAFNFILKYLKERNIHYRHTQEQSE